MDRENYDHVLESGRVNIVREIKIVLDLCPANTILSILRDLFTRLVRGESELQRLAVAGDEGSEL